MARAIDEQESPFQQGAEEGKKPRGRRVATMPDWAPLFLGAISAGYHVTHAARVAGVNPCTPYERRSTDELFRRAWKEASDIGTEYLEEEAARRAFHGTLKPVFHKGVQCGVTHEYSDTLLIFLLKARNPAKYREGVDVDVMQHVTLNVNVVNVGEGTGPLPSIPVATVAGAFMTVEQLPKIEQPKI